MNAFCLGFFLRLHSMTVEHVEEICITHGVQLVSALQLQPLFLNRSVNTLWVMVAPNCDLMSSPMRGVFFSLERSFPYGTACDEERHVVDESDSGLHSTIRIEPGSLLRTHGRVIEKNFRS